MRPAALLTRTVVALLAVMLGWAFYPNSQIAARFERVTTGSSNHEVVSLLGRPSWVEPCGKSFGAAKANCTEYIYRNSFAPLIPEYHSVSFDTSGHVIDKAVYSSP